MYKFKFTSCIHILMKERNYFSKFFFISQKNYEKKILKFKYFFLKIKKYQIFKKL